MPFRRLQTSDTTNPERLRLYLEDLQEEILRISQLVDQSAAVRGRLTSEDLLLIRDELQTGGVAELDVTNLNGVLAEGQNAGFARVDVLPDPSNTEYTAVVLIGSGGAPDQINALDKTVNPPEWIAIDTAPANMVTTDTVQSITAAKTFTAAVDFDSTIAVDGQATFNGVVRYNGPNGAYVDLTYSTEEVTLNTAGVTTDSTANLLVAFTECLGFVAYVTETISGGGVTGVQVGDATTLARFGSVTTLSSGSATYLIAHRQGSITTDATGPIQSTNAKIRFTATGGTPSQGKIRIVAWRMAYGFPTS